MFLGLTKKDVKKKECLVNFLFKGGKKMKFTKKEWENIKFVCNRDDFGTGNITEEGDFIYADIECSEERLEEVLEDAKCEAQRNATQARIPVYSYRTVKNPEKLERLKKLYGKNGFHVLQDDVEKFRKEKMFGYE